jgi:hypothetical protein
MVIGSSLRISGRISAVENADLRQHLPIYIISDNMII